MIVVVEDTMAVEVDRRVAVEENRVADPAIADSQFAAVVAEVWAYTSMIAVAILEMAVDLALVLAGPSLAVMEVETALIFPLLHDVDKLCITQQTVA
jgi:hypothetical protein